MEVSIEINDAAVRQALSRAPERINRAMRAAMVDSTTYLLRQVKTYPPPRAYRQVTRKSRLYSQKGSRQVTGQSGRYWASTYRRTGTLGRSWKRSIDGSGVSMTGRVSSSGAMAPYNFRVQGPLSGDDHQAWMHRGRWASIDEIRDRSTAQINEMFRNRIEAAIGG